MGRPYTSLILRVTKDHHAIMHTYQHFPLELLGVTSSFFHHLTPLFRKDFISDNVCVYYFGSSSL